MVKYSKKSNFSIGFFYLRIFFLSEYLYKRRSSCFGANFRLFPLFVKPLYKWQTDKRKASVARLPVQVSYSGLNIQIVKMAFYLVEPLGDQAGIDFGGFAALVAEQDLDVAQVYTIFK